MRAGRKPHEEPSHCWRDVRCAVWRFLQKLNTESPYAPESPYAQGNFFPEVKKKIPPKKKENVKKRYLGGGSFYKLYA